MKKEPSQLRIEAISEHSVFKLVVGLGFLSVVLYFAVYYFTQVVEEVNEYRYEMVSDRFYTSMFHAHKQWMLNGRRKSYVMMDYLIEAPVMDGKTPDRSSEVARKMILRVSKRGWPLNVSKDETELNCLSLWMYFAHKGDQPKGMFNLTENLEIKQSETGCWYYQQVDDGLSFMFSYFPELGQVISAKENLTIIQSEKMAESQGN